MKIREIISEDWWKDLDPGFLSMMGYTDDTQHEQQVDLAGEVDRTVKAIRANH